MALFLFQRDADPKPVNYRPYHPDDLAALYAIEEICFQPPFRFPRRHMRRLLESPGTITWIADEDGQMAGFAVADFEGETGGIVAYIQTIEVLPATRSRGIGSELLRRLEDSAREGGAKSIWLHVDSENAGAVRLYEAHGYACEGRHDRYYPQGRAALIYRKIVGAPI
jgi:ribosomal-protein-alanine N-acetyltransferase